MDNRVNTHMIKKSKSRLSWKDSIRHTFEYIALLFPVAFKSAMKNRNAFYLLNSVMFIQNLLFFMTWVVYFNNFSNIRGWELPDVAAMFGLFAFSFGLAFLLFGGTLELGRAIIEGELDSYLGKPRSPLIGLLCKESRVPGLGDILTAVALWTYYCDYSLGQYVTLFILGLCASIIMLATILVIHCLPFFVNQTERLTTQLSETFVIISLYPHNGFGMAIRTVLMTIIPAGFIAYLPIEAVRSMNLWLVGAMIMAAVFYLWVAAMLFYYGLNRYTSGNKFLDMK